MPGLVLERRPAGRGRDGRLDLKPVDLFQRKPEHLHRRFEGGEGDDQVAVVLHHVRIVDVATADEPAHLVEHESVAAHGEHGESRLTPLACDTSLATACTDLIFGNDLKSIVRGSSGTQPPTSQRPAAPPFIGHTFRGYAGDYAPRIHTFADVFPGFFVQGLIGDPSK